MSIRAILGMSDSALKAYADSLPPLTDEEIKMYSENLNEAKHELFPTAQEAEENLVAHKREMREKGIGPFG